METKDRNDELMELKGQMELLKQQLHKKEIISEDQIAEVAETYKPKHLWIRILSGAFLGLGVSLNIIQSLIMHFDELSVWHFCIGIACVLLFVAFYAIMGAGVYYEVCNGHLMIRHSITKKMLKDIPIDKIRFIEFMAKKRDGARIMYNKYDDFYLREVNYNELVKDILRVNPDIEIRRELA